MKGTGDQKNCKGGGLINKGFDFILDIGLYLGMAMMFLCMIGISINVIARYYFNSPINWVMDAGTLSLIFMTYLGSAWLLREEGHVSLDILAQAMGDKYKYVALVFNVICIVMCCIVVWFSITVIQENYAFDTRADMTITPPKWALYLTIPIGFTMIGLEFLRKVINFFIQKNN